MTTKTALKIFVVILIFSGFAGTLPVNAADSAWVSKAPMQEARCDLGVAVVNRKIYAIGGAGSKGFSSTNEEYDPATNIWTFRAPMPTPRSAFGIVVYKNKIYCFGGYAMTGTTGTATGVNEVYDPATNTWANRASMPTARLNLRANLVNDKIYLIGGIPVPDTGRTLNEVYDPTSDIWTTKAPVPTGVDSYGSAVVGNKIFVETSTLNQIYDAENNSWSAGAVPPMNSLHASAAVAKASDSSEHIYLFGTDAQGPYWMLNYQGFTTQSYDPATNNWAVCTSVPTGRFSPGVAEVNDKIFVLGGYSYGEHISVIQRSIIYSAANEQYTPALDISVPANKTQTTSQTPNSPIPQPTLGSMQPPTKSTQSIGTNSVPQFGKTEPNITILSPQNKSYTSTDIKLDFNVRQSVSWVGMSLDGQETAVITSNMTLAGLTNGLHNVTVFTRFDSENLNASDTVTFSVIPKNAQQFTQPKKQEPFPTTLIATAFGISVFAVSVSFLLLNGNKRKNSEEKANTSLSNNRSRAANSF